MFNIIKKVYSFGLKSNNTHSDIICISTLFIPLIENNINKIDWVIPNIIEFCYNNIINLKDSTNLQIVNIEMVK